ncbi:AraC family transcriptional regulator [bacterium]|nr:AraC family transcriptional regulator [bacterium]
MQRRLVAVAHIAEQTGFRDSSALIRVFKKATGTTPGAYRAAHLGSGN